MRRHSHPVTSVLMQLDFLSLLIAFAQRLRRREVIYVRTTLRHRLWERLLSKLGIDCLDLMTPRQLNLATVSYDEVGREFACRVDTWAETSHWKETLSALGGTAYVDQLLRVLIQKSAAPTYAEAFAVITWLQTYRLHAVVYASSPWEFITLESHYRRSQYVDIRRSHHAFLRRLLPSLTQVKTRAARLLQSTSRLRHAFSNTAASRSQEEPPQHGTQSRVLVILNRGLEYGGLYSYRYLLESNAESELSWSNVRILSRNGGPVGENLSSEPWPWPKERLPSRIRRWIRHWRLPQGMPRVVATRLDSGVAQSQLIAAAFERLYPSLHLVLYAFDAQVPIEISLALESIGIRTVALQERPVTAVTSTVPIGVETLLTASEYFSEANYASRSVAVRNCRPIGMWRSDLLHGLISEGRVDPTHQRNRLMIVALPYHVSVEARWSNHPLATSPLTMRHFVRDVIRLATELPEVDFIIRGKNAEWSEMSSFADLMDEIRACPNLTVSREYTRLNESYRLCRRATLVVAKHTSLVEECLSVGIPCLLHDYSWNYKEYERHTVPFIPESLWVESYEDLQRKVQEILFGDQTADGLHRVVAEVQREIFGCWADGGVRLRSRSILQELLANQQIGMELGELAEPSTAQDLSLHESSQPESSRRCAQP